MTGRLCLTPDCGGAYHARGKCNRCWMTEYRARNRPPHAERGLNPDQLRRLADILDRDAVSGIAIARPGEILKLSREWSRSQQSVTQRLTRMRADRRAGLRRGPGGLKGKNRGPLWTADQLDALEAILDRDCEGIGSARAGELAMVADRIGRTAAAVRARLHKMRRQRIGVLGSGLSVQIDGSRQCSPTLPGTL